MQRMINDPDQVVPDMLRGFVKAHRDIVVPNRSKGQDFQYP